MLDALAAIVKALTYASLLTSSGAVLADFSFRGISYREAQQTMEYAIRVARTGAIFLMLFALTNIAVLVMRLGGQWDGATLSAIFSSSTGAALFLQLTGAALVLSTREFGERNVRIAGASLMALALGFNGHAASMGPFEGLMVFFHVSSAAWWLGSLWLLKFACTTVSSQGLSVLVSQFSKLASLIVGALVIAGFLLIYVLVGFNELPSLSAYEQNLARKLFAVAIVFALAAYNKFRLTPRLLIGDANAARTLKRTITIEMIVFGLVLCLTSVMTTFTSPHDDG